MKWWSQSIFTAKNSIRGKNNILLTRSARSLENKIDIFARCKLWEYMSLN